MRDDNNAHPFSNQSDCTPPEAEIRIAEEDLSASPALDSAVQQALDGMTVRITVGTRTLYLNDRRPLPDDFDAIEPHEIDAAFLDAADEILDPSLLDFRNTTDISEKMESLRPKGTSAGLSSPTKPLKDQGHTNLDGVPLTVSAVRKRYSRALRHIQSLFQDD